MSQIAFDTRETRPSDKTSIVELANAMVRNNDFDAVIIVCPKGQGGTMTIGLPVKEEDGGKNVFEGTEILWKDLARIVGSGGEPVIVSRVELQRLMNGANEANQALGDLLGAANALSGTSEKYLEFLPAQIQDAMRDLAALVKKGFPNKGR